MTSFRDDPGAGTSIFTNLNNNSNIFLLFPFLILEENVFFLNQSEPSVIFYFSKSILIKVRSRVLIKNVWSLIGSRNQCNLDLLFTSWKQIFWTKRRNINFKTQVKVKCLSILWQWRSMNFKILINHYKHQNNSLQLIVNFVIL